MNDNRTRRLGSSARWGKRLAKFRGAEALAEICDRPGKKQGEDIPATPAQSRTRPRVNTWSSFLLIGLLILAPFWTAAETLRAGEAQAAGKLDPAVEKAFVDFAGKIEATINAGDASLLDKAIDMNALLARTVQGLNVPKKLVSGFRAGIGNFKFGTAVVTRGIQNGGSYKFLRLRHTNGETRALFRFLQNADGGLNYHELVLTQTPKGQPRVTDLYVHAGGEYMSDTFRRGFLPAIAEKNKGFFARLTGQQSDYIKSLPKIQATQQLAKQGKMAKALAALKALPASLQTDKNILIMRVFYALEVDEAEYAAALDAMRKAYPKDPCLDLLCLDALIIRKQYAETIRAADRIDRSIGGDPYLHVFRSNVYYTAKKLDKARQCAEKAMAEEPTLADAHFALIGICLDQKDYAKVAATLTIIEKDLGVELNDLGELPAYAGFVKSDEYKKWLAGRKPPATAPGINAGDM